MRKTAELLGSIETCQRKGFWAQNWRRRKLDGTGFLYEAIRAGLTETEREDYGVVAGELCMDMAVLPGMEMPSSQHLHESVLHHAALSDMLTTALRRPGSDPWVPMQPTTLEGAPWVSSAFLDPSGERLRRFILVSHWNDARHYSEIRSWEALGEVCAYDLPMTMAVCVLGQNRNGRRGGAFSKAFQHPVNHGIRFRKKTKVSSETFSERWSQIWREEHAEITNEEWLRGMMNDDILRDVCFTVDIPPPEEKLSRRIREMAVRKIEKMERTKVCPEGSLSVCDRPACQFKPCCWAKNPFTPADSDLFCQISLT
jgi:hypothetical protein